MLAPSFFLSRRSLQALIELTFKVCLYIKLREEFTQHSLEVTASKLHQNAHLRRENYLIILQKQDQKAEIILSILSGNICGYTYIIQS